MPKTDPRVDAYIAKSADFAKPILIHLRKLVHEACSDCEETIKWGVPFFEYKGPFCSMAAFKAHCVFGFAKTSLLPDPKGILIDKKEEAAGVMGRITNVRDLPPGKTILSFLKAAKKLNDDGIKIPAKKAEVKKELPVPGYMTKALKKNKKAFFTFEEFSPSHKSEYIEWITEAKTVETRERRMETMIEWLAEGKPRHWKYQRR